MAQHSASHCLHLPEEIMTRSAMTILLVEDNPDHAELAIQGLRSQKMANTIQHVVDGEEALDYVFRRGRFADTAHYPHPDLILLDLRLPKVDGLEVLKILKTDEHVRKIPVVVLTTSESESDVAEAYAHHANSYMVKPVTFEKFMALADVIGFYWLAWNRKP